eukprot:gnl/TRDRNA2_/TRDRNA2_174789_c2_seq10.p1 gnl/TRDRNA2_/TRDRNA2_174789_c2~~gnl/TRDRNA2_/TRDRNA2_174789_c2_seq10.p1  ORF type:complete len:291 (-),score=30.58 gnl/TRDRNA2_/TRDRNA2_174789_c2_seq10:868-1740(-)
MTLNLQYFASYPQDADVGRRVLQDLVNEVPRPDIICVQEGLAGRQVLTEVGYRRIIGSDEEVPDSTGKPRVLAQSIGDMVYWHQATLKNISESDARKLLINELYIRDDCVDWEVQECGILQTSSDLELDGRDTDRISGHLAIRTAAWARLRAKNAHDDDPKVWVLNTHLTGGRFEDQFYLQQLTKERYEQSVKIMNFFESRAKEGDTGIMVGDFNATTNYSPGGPMHGYFASGIVTSTGVQYDTSALGIEESMLEEHFKQYMVSPFRAIDEKQWRFCYTQDGVQNRLDGN